MNAKASTQTLQRQNMEKNTKKFLRILHVDYFQKAFLSDSNGRIQFNKRYMLISADPFTRYMNIWIKGSHSTQWPNI